MLRDARIIIPDVIRALDEAEVPYYIGGSVASSTFGGNRLTEDVDLIIQLREDQVAALVTILKPAFYTDEEMIREAMSEGGMFNIIHMESMFKADVYIPIMDGWTQTQMDRRRMAGVDPQRPEVQGFVSSPEDILLQKLRWYRLGREVSQKQWTDVLNLIMIKRHALDYTYIDKWAAFLKVADLLERAISEVDAEIKAKIQD